MTAAVDSGCAGVEEDEAFLPLLDCLLLDRLLFGEERSPKLDRPLRSEAKLLRPDFGSLWMESLRVLRPDFREAPL